LLRSAALLAALVFLQSLIATVEVVQISRLKPLQAAFWGALNTTCYISGTIIVIVSKRRLILAASYVASATAGTYLGVYLAKAL